MSDAGGRFMAKLAPKWKGPATVKTKLGPVNYRVVQDSKPDTCETVHVENLKKFYASSIESGGGGM